jgi:hypothetical protein
LVFSLNTIKELRSLAREAGLRHIRVRFEHRTLRYPVPAGLGAGFMGETPMAAQFAALGDDQKQAFVAHAVDQLTSYIDDAGPASPMENHFLTASKLP